MGGWSKAKSKLGHSRDFKGSCVTAHFIYGSLPNHTLHTHQRNSYNWKTYPFSYIHASCARNPGYSCPLSHILFLEKGVLVLAQTWAISLLWPCCDSLFGNSSRLCVDYQPNVQLYSIFKPLLVDLRFKHNPNLSHLHLVFAHSLETYPRSKNLHILTRQKQTALKVA